MEEPFTLYWAYGEVLLKNHKDEVAVTILRQATAMADDLFGLLPRYSIDSKGVLVKALKKIGQSSES